MMTIYGVQRKSNDGKRFVFPVVLWSRYTHTVAFVCSRWTSLLDMFHYDWSATKSNVNMQILFNIECFILLILANLRRQSNILVQADPASCRKQVECFVCDSREIQECEDANFFSQVQIPTRLCDDYCLKMWTRENDSITGDNKTSALRYVRRDCHKIFQYQIKKAETCYKHKKHRTDSLCLCGSDRCNSARRISLQRTYDLVFFSLFSILLYSCLFDFWI